MKFNICVLIQQDINENSKPVFEMLIESAAACLKYHFPWYFIPYQQELKYALTTLDKDKIPLTSVTQIAESKSEPSSGFSQFTSHPNITPFLRKMLELLDRMVMV